MKQAQKKKKKQMLRNEKKVSAVADVLENFTFGTKADEKYDFETDYTMKDE